ncbi:MAG TPA: histidine kinase [Gemmatimonadaceae bacterium]|nr:histidine kinase [Gemmatimonadaceae bacterium]
MSSSAVPPGRDRGEDGQSGAGRRRLLAAGAVLGLCVFVGLMEAGQTYLRFSGGPKPITWVSALDRTMWSWLLLAALTPAMIYLGDRFPVERGAWRRNAAVHLAAATAFAVVHLGAFALIYYMRGETTVSYPELVRRYLTWYFVVELLTYAAIVGVVHALHYYRELRARELAASQLQARLTEARLEALRGQLNPHFLFNTLNAISVLALKGEREAVVHTLGCLSDLLRISLDEKLSQEVPLSREIEFLNRYLEIQRVRFGDRLVVETEVDAEARDALVPSMIMQPLVENAIVHGVGARRGPGRIRIRARREEGALRLQVEDSGPGFAHADGGGGGGRSASPEPSAAAARRGGIGLANTRARLEQLYGAAQHRLELGHSADGGAQVTIRIPLRHPQSSFAASAPPPPVSAALGEPVGAQEVLR